MRIYDHLMYFALTKKHGKKENKGVTYAQDLLSEFMTRNPKESTPIHKFIKENIKGEY